MEGEQTGWVIQQNVRNEAVQVHVNEGQVVRTCSRTDLGIFHFKCFKFGCHTHVNAGIVVRTLSRTDLAWRIPSQIWLSQRGFIYTSCLLHLWVYKYTTCLVTLLMFLHIVR